MLTAVDNMSLTVYGMPGPQGSKRHVGNGVMVESSAKVKPWREAIKWAALEQGKRIVGPVAIQIIFTLPKPKSAPKSRITFPDRKPDLDKLLRSTFDALCDIGVIDDDARVVSIHAVKVFPGESDHALSAPGAFIQVTAI